ncbi:gfo/Idh/MocA family oxidoreductase [Pseudonocardiaceae bacterium YIM PH 21723]|nr:gfo/Idh/MocA family oxidoreductase [Pseudonocardiaceae bacterium YIM PH 21723]
MTEHLNRRSLLAASAALGATALTGTPAQAQPATAEADAPARTGKSMIGVPFQRYGKVRVAMIGLGNRGLSMLPLFLAVPDVSITAVCDVRQSSVDKAVDLITKAGRDKPATYTDFEKLVGRDDIDLVYIATPWDWHVPMSLAAMRAGKHVGVECPFAMTVGELWQLVDTSERTQRHCMQLENCCYGKNELRVLRMAHAGKFGELLHGAGAYMHDLRKLLFADDYYADEWRRKFHTTLNADHYPTHGLGPVASYMDINRGDRFVKMTSMATPALGLAEYREANEQPGDSSWGEKYVAGDTTISLIQTAKGRVIRLQHDVSTPHPYSRLNQLAGTKGCFEDYPPRIYLEPEHTDDRWKDFEAYKNFDHWLWTDVGPGPGGHGGMDYVMLYRTLQTMKLGLVPDIDVYDSASWSAPVALSAHSLKAGSAPMPFPDFTRGAWKQARPGIDSVKPG